MGTLERAWLRGRACHKPQKAGAGEFKLPSTEDQPVSSPPKPRKHPRGSGETLGMQSAWVPAWPCLASSTAAW